MTYTVAMMPVPPTVYRDIKKRLEDAGYQHAIDQHGHLDMTHIALEPAPALEREHRFGAPPEPMMNPSADWCDRYAAWYFQEQD